MYISFHLKVNSNEDFTCQSSRKALLKLLLAFFVCVCTHSVGKQ